jgi:hypothetical protein
MSEKGKEKVTEQQKKLLEARKKTKENMKEIFGKEGKEDLKKMHKD